MSWREAILIRGKAVSELGPAQTAEFARYRLALRSGWLRRATPPGGRLPARWLDELARQEKPGPRPLLALPDVDDLRAVVGAGGLQALRTEADEIVDGRVRLFGGPPVAIELVPFPNPAHWTAYELGQQPLLPPECAHNDVKWIWEPGRFGWAYTLGRAYRVSGDEHYAAAFWYYTERFLDGNPPNLGLHWVSAQEVALRLMALSFAAQVFAPSEHSTPERLRRLSRALAEHAARIPPSLSYAKAQNNNHLLSEAAGLYSAGLALPRHPQAQRWRDLGWRLFQRGLRKQIAADGAYVQHSSNYHRLALQLALWMQALANGPAQAALPGYDRGSGSTTPQRQEKSFAPDAAHKLAQSTRWLSALLDPQSGSLPNLGPNDGALILPLSTCAHSDFRPTLAAASLAFLGQRSLPDGAWDELALWLLGKERLQSARRAPNPAWTDNEAGPGVLRPAFATSWAYLRAAHFHSRPGHADQLHLDLWWHGLNVALDPGTYLYNAPAPWDNALMSSAVHNTLTIEDQDQMRRAGRFLWLDWAQAEVEAPNKTAPKNQALHKLAASHNGYRRLGLVHKRQVEVRKEHWLVQDWVLEDKERRRKPEPVRASLHWLLPDWPWQLFERQGGIILRISSPYGPITLRIKAVCKAERPQPATRPAAIEVRLVRAGEALRGPAPAPPTWGWISPTYGYKRPALSLHVSLQARPPFLFISRWHFPE